MAFSQQTYQGQGIVQNQANNQSGQILGENIRTAAEIIAEAVGKKKERAERNKIIEGTNKAMEQVRSLYGMEEPEGYGEMGLKEKAAYNEFFLTSELPEIRRKQQEAEMQEQYGKAAQALGLPQDLHPELFDDVLRGQQQKAQNAAMLNRINAEYGLRARQSQEAHEQAMALAELRNQRYAPSGNTPATPQPVPGVNRLLDLIPSTLQDHKGLKQAANFLGNDPNGYDKFLDILKDVNSVQRSSTSSQEDWENLLGDDQNLKDGKPQGILSKLATPEELSSIQGVDAESTADARRALLYERAVALQNNPPPIFKADGVTLDRKAMDRQMKEIQKAVDTYRRATPKGVRTHMFELPDPAAGPAPAPSGSLMGNGFLSPGG